MFAGHGAVALNKKGIKMTETVEKTENGKNLLTAFVAGFKNIFNFKTRASKYDYWAFVFANILFSLILLVAGMLLSPLFPIMVLYGGIIIYYAYSIVEFIAVLALSVRRLHDTNHSGQLLWLPVIFGFCMILGIVLDTKLQAVVFGTALMAASGIAFLGVIVWLFILYLRKGQAEENRFGKPVEEDSKYDKFANLYIILYVLISIAAGVANYIADNNSKNVDTVSSETSADTVDANTDSNADTDTDTDTDAQEPTAAEPAEAKPETQTENSAEVETPNIPMHESAE